MKLHQQNIEELIRRARALSQEKQHLEETLLARFLTLSVQGARHLENGIIDRGVELERLERKLKLFGVDLKLELAKTLP